jgi:Na+-transporting NADH:ubiquinone oxidoreductase subunit E
MGWGWLLFFFLEPGALAWLGFPDVDLSFLVFISFIATIAAMVQIVEMVMERYLPSLYSSLGIFLPLIAVNCAILGTSLFMDVRDYNFSEATVFGLGSGFGWYLAIMAFSAVRQKLRYADMPKGLDGFAINMISAGLIALAFLAFAGIKLV